MSTQVMNVRTFGKNPTWKTIYCYAGTCRDDNKDGNDSQNWMYGFTGSDTLKGLGGNDLIFGGEGGDKLYGGDGNDKLWGGTTLDYVNGEWYEYESNDLYGENGNDNLYGGDKTDHLYGGSGNDKLFGGKGDDKLYFGLGKDELRGGEGTDKFILESELNDINTDVIHDFDSASESIDISTLGIQATSILIKDNGDGGFNASYKDVFSIDVYTSSLTKSDFVTNITK